MSAVGPQAIRRVIAAPEATDLIARLDAGVMRAPSVEVEAFLIACNETLTNWARSHSYVELAAALTREGAVFSRVYDANDVVADSHYRAREDLIEVPDPTLGPILMQGVVPKFPGHEHNPRHAGQSRGADNVAFYTGRLGLSREDVDALERDGVI